MTRETQALTIPSKLEKNAINILDMISGGADEKEICDHFSIRRGTFIQWMITFPQFETAVVEARKQRADSYRSIIQDRLYIDEVEYENADDLEGTKTGKRILRTLDKDSVPGEKLLFDQLKWLAEIDNPDKYGTKVKHEGGSVMPVQIVVDTGIKSQEDKKKPIVETESKPVTYDKMDF